MFDDKWLRHSNLNAERLISRRRELHTHGQYQQIHEPHRHVVNQAAAVSAGDDTGDSARTGSEQDQWYQWIGGLSGRLPRWSPLPAIVQRGGVPGALMYTAR